MNGGVYDHVVKNAMIELIQEQPRFSVTKSHLQFELAQIKSARVATGIPVQDAQTRKKG
jgi:hypothetical protein